MYFSKVYTLLIKSVYTFVKSVYTFEKYIKSTPEVHQKCIKNSYNFLTDFMKSFDTLHHIVSKNISSILVGLAFT